MADRTDIEVVIENGIDVANRRIYFGALFNPDGESSEFDWRTVERAVRAIHKFSQSSKRPIEIHMSSYGGCTAAMLRLHDVILACPCQIKFFGGGEIMSSASFIMAACDERYLYPNTSVMLHKHSGGVYPEHQFTDQKIWFRDCELLDKKLMQIYTDNSLMSFEFWEEATKRDLLLTADEVIALGLADRIVEPKKRGNLRKMRTAIMSHNTDQKRLRRLAKTLMNRTQHNKSLKIEVNVPEEQHDKNVYVEEPPSDPELPSGCSEPLKKYEDHESSSNSSSDKRSDDDSR